MNIRKQVNAVEKDKKKLNVDYIGGEAPMSLAEEKEIS